MELVTEFNTSLLQFITELKRLIPTEIRFKGAYITIKELSIADPQQPIKTFIDTVYEYREHLIKGDDAFFLNKDLYGNDKDAINVFNILSNYWDTTSDNNKKSILKYIQLLTEIVDEYIEENN